MEEFDYKESWSTIKDITSTEVLIAVHAVHHGSGSEVEQVYPL